MSSDTPLRIKLFAGLREHVGAEHLALSVPAGTTVEGLKALIRREVPALAPYLEATRVAVNLAFAAGTQTIAPTDEVALIPPVSGG